MRSPQATQFVDATELLAPSTVLTAAGWMPGSVVVPTTTSLALLALVIGLAKTTTA